MGDFKKVGRRKIGLLDDKELIEYQKSAIKYYGNLTNQLAKYKALEIIHPLLLFLVNFYPVRIKELNKLQLPDDGGSVIFSANHSNAMDFPVIARVVKKHFFIMADYTMQNDCFVNILNKLNGCVYVDRKSKQSKENAFFQSVDGVNNGYNMVLFCESTWNLLKNQPMLPRKWGDIRIAQATGRPIIPMAIAYNQKNCYVKFGKTRYVLPDEDIKRVDDELYEEMCELRLSIWNSSIYLKNYQEIDYDKWLVESLKSYKYFDAEYEMSMIRTTDDSLMKQIAHVIEVSEKIRPTSEIEKKLLAAKINYRLK